METEMETSTETITNIIEKYHGIRVDGNHGLGGNKTDSDDWCGVIERAGYISQKSFNEEPVRLHNVDTLPIPTASLSKRGTNKEGF
jgi:hypothetical protein